jgi:hypothetical protein
MQGLDVLQLEVLSAALLRLLTTFYWLVVKCKGLTTTFENLGHSSLMYAPPLNQTKTFCQST